MSHAIYDSISQVVLWPIVSILVEDKVTLVTNREDGHGYGHGLDELEQHVPRYQYGFGSYVLVLDCRSNGCTFHCAASQLWRELGEVNKTTPLLADHV